MPRLPTKTLVASAALFAVLPLKSATFFTDTFDSGLGSWVAAANMTIAVNTSDALGTGNSLAGTTDGASVNLLALGFTSRTLTNVGDSLSVSFDYRWATINSGNGATDRLPAFGFYNSQGTGGYEDDRGYNVGVSTTTVKFQSETGGNNTALAGSDETTLPDATANHIYSASPDGPVMHFTFTLTRVDTGLQLTTTLTPSGASEPTVDLSTTVTSPLTFTYDEFLLRSRATNYYLDNVTLDFTASSVPEPGASALLAGSAMLGLVAFRRRR